MIATLLTFSKRLLTTQAPPTYANPISSLEIFTFRLRALENKENIQKMLLLLYKVTTNNLFLKIFSLNQILFDRLQLNHF